MENAKKAIITEILRIKKEQIITDLENDKKKLTTEKEEVEKKLKDLNQEIAQLEKKISDVQAQLEKEERQLRTMTFAKLGEILDNLYGGTVPTPKEVKEPEMPKELEEITPDKPESAPEKPEEIETVKEPEEPEQPKEKITEKPKEMPKPVDKQKPISSPYSEKSVAELSVLFNKRFNALESNAQKNRISIIFYNEVRKALGHKPESANEIPKEVFIKLLNLMDKETAGGK